MATKKKAETYRHDDDALLRPDVGTQAQFRKRKAPRTYRCDYSLSPALDWDGQNSAREAGEWLLAQIEEAAGLEPPHRFDASRRFGELEVSGLHDAVAELKALSRPFLDWAGKAERLSFDVPTLPTASSALDLTQAWLRRKKPRPQAPILSRCNSATAPSSSPRPT